MVYALILGSGVGSRMGTTTLPKQFLKIGNKPIIIHTIEQFILSTHVDKIVAVVSSNYEDYLKDLFRKYKLDDIDIAIGGPDRSISMINGCNYILDNYAVNDDDIIITHDAVRPFVTTRIINDNIDKIKSYNAITTVIPATDTIAEIDKNIISSIPIRSKMFQVQTPQTFRLKELVYIYNSLSIKEKELLTDACKIYSLKNKKIGYVSGEKYNFKITTKFDLNVAHNIVNGNIEL